MRLLRDAAWLLRLGFAAWLVPAGLNHFVGLFPQPPGNQPISQEVLAALIGSGLFALVKAVELAAGLALMFGRFVPLALVMLLPVSFNVWYWDVELQGWTSVSAWYGWAVLGANVLLCLAWWPSYRAMLAWRGGGTEPTVRQLWPLRLMLGLSLLLGGLNALAGPWWPLPTGSTPHAVQLLTALQHSGLLAVAFGILLVAGALLVAGLFVPLALAAALAVNVGALFWAMWLDLHLLWGPAALLVVVMNTMLMLAWLPAYLPMLQPRPLAVGETPVDRYEDLFANPRGGLDKSRWALGAVLLALACAFYWLMLPPILGTWNMVFLIIPAAVLLAKLPQKAPTPI